MKKDEQIRLLKLLMQRLDDGTNVDAGVMLKNPTSVYTCPEMARTEKENFFRGYPQLIGLSGDLPEPGSFLTTNDFGVPVLATRAKDGQFRAFLNVCSHRGVVLEDEPSGTRNRFVCPFHAWTYGSDGALVGVPKQEHFGKLDKECHGLIPLPAEERHGFLLVHPDPKGEIDVDHLLGGLAPEFESWNWGNLIKIGKDTYDMPLNWKLSMDTFGETYHFTALHKNTLALTFYGNVQCYDTFGRNHRMILCTKEIDTLRGTPEEDWEICQGSFPVYYLFPNVQINIAPFGMILVRAYPDPTDPGRSFSRVSFYARAEPLEANRDLLMDVTQRFSDVIRDEDYAVAARSQLGANSGLQEHVIFGRNEPALHHYHNTYRAALGMKPLEEYEG
jgi:phenylpropionate dioxygenase-like ring-hydroxylating dioxygenase large terminal subunit